MVWKLLKNAEKAGVNMVLLRQILGNYAENEADRKHDREEDITFWIPGDPATFATSGEKPWKEILANHIPVGCDMKAFGLDMQFFLKDLAPRGHSLDIDNLCEPLFSVVINRHRWFSGRRPNINWWSASKTQSTDSGLKLTIFARPVHEVNLGEVKQTPFFNQTYTGRLPKNATDPVLSQWLESLLVDKPLNSCVILLRFGDKKVNLGDIATGRIKALLDGLYHLYGGTIGRPEDWRIRTLAVEKGNKELAPNSVKITVWEAI